MCNLPTQEGDPDWQKGQNDFNKYLRDHAEKLSHETQALYLKENEIHNPIIICEKMRAVANKWRELKKPEIHTEIQAVDITKSPPQGELSLDFFYSDDE